MEQKHLGEGVSDENLGEVSGGFLSSDGKRYIREKKRPPELSPQGIEDWLDEFEKRNEELKDRGELK